MGPRQGVSPRTEVEEGALLDALRAGREDAFELLVQSYAGRMRATALRILHDPSEADDALQDAFLSAFKSLARFEGRAGLGTWLQRIQINAALMKLRAKKPVEEAEIDELLPRFLGLGIHAEPRSCWGEPPDDPVAREELCTHVRAAIQGLPEKFRIPVLLRDIEGLSNEELANHLGISVNAAKIRVHRGRQALRALLEPRWGSFTS